MTVRVSIFWKRYRAPERENIDKRIPREDFATVAELIYAAIRQSREDDVTSPDGVEEFLDEVAIFDLEAKTDDRTDFSVAFYSVDAPLTGFCVRSRLGMMIPLLDGEELLISSLSRQV